MPRPLIRRLVVGAVSVGGVAVLTLVISVTDRESVRPILGYKWDWQNRVVVDVACTPDSETVPGGANPYRGSGQRPDPHACSDAS
jgi:hypothetical protein